jgi:cell division protein FtsN
VERSQVVWLTLGALVTLGVAFALGVVVGRRAAQFSEPGVAANAVARADAAGDIHDKLTFYDKLTTAHPSTAPAQAAPAPNKASPAATPTPPAAGDPDAAIRMALARGPSASGEYTVQVSAYQSMAEASAFTASLKRKGFSSFVVRAEVAGKGTWYRVRLGRFATEAEAARAKGILAAADVPAWVLKTE